MLYGAIGGAAGGAAGDMCQIYKIGSEAAAVIQVSSAAMLGGIISELNGGSFSQGAIISAGAAAASMGLGGVGGPGASESDLIEVDPNGEQFTNPTGGNMRGCDSQGCGHYGASRGGRIHLGIDLVTTVGQDIVAPFDGKAFEIKSAQYPGVRIVGGKYTSDILYMNASSSISNGGGGLSVSAGEFIGTDRDIAGRYPGITNHIHFQMKNTGGSLFINPTPFIYPNGR